MSRIQLGQNKKKIPECAGHYLKKTVIPHAHARMRYRWGINQIERFVKSGKFDEKLIYTLGLFYDHLVIFKTSKMKNARGRKLSRKYLKKAESLYKKILVHNPKSLWGHHGLARVYGQQKDFRRAIAHEKRAYRLLLKRPKAQQGALGVGSLYLAQGDIRGAERWFKKELRNLGSRDVGANANLMSFYYFTKNFRKALPCALHTEKLLNKELRKSAYKRGNAPASHNAAVKVLMARIRKIRAHREQ